jgi:precorrin-6A/cobalt-precorrin-6A reductase
VIADLSLPALRILMLGGTGDARKLAQALIDDGRLQLTYSVAGRTRTPLLPDCDVHHGGFGGIEGLVAMLHAQQIALVVDATHPYAAQMSAHAAAACAEADVPLLALRRPAWSPGPDDQWLSVPDMKAAAKALGWVPQRVLLTIGQLELGPFIRRPQHQYVIRTVEPPGAFGVPLQSRVITARGPFSVDDEKDLLRKHYIEKIITKNSGGSATIAKLVAAREMEIPVIMVARPSLPDVAHTVETPEAAQGWIGEWADRTLAERMQDHAGTRPTARGV